MEYRRKLKPDRSITGFIPAIFCLLIFGVVLILKGVPEAILSAALFFAGYAGFSAWIFYRTRNQSYLAASIWQLAFGLFLATNPRYTLISGITPVISSVIYVILFSSTIWLLYLFVTRKAKWKGRDLFELASMSIGPEPDGFTRRPHPVGKAEYTREELYGFAAFLRKNLIAMPYYEEHGIVFVPVKMGDEFGYIFQPEKFRRDRTWIAFDFPGNVTVNISGKDYVDYKEELSFDQLCENLGQLFIGFIRYYCKDESGRILYNLERPGLGITS